MSKPVLPVTITTSRKKSATMPALFDSGSFYSIIRRDCLPEGTRLEPVPSVPTLRGAGRGSRLKVAGSAQLVITIGKKKIWESALVSPDLTREMIIGARAMQAWDISIKNGNGHTTVEVARHMDDPETTEVD